MSLYVEDLSTLHLHVYLIHCFHLELHSMLLWHLAHFLLSAYDPRYHYHHHMSNYRINTPCLLFGDLCSFSFKSPSNGSDKILIFTLRLCQSDLNMIHLSIYLSYKSSIMKLQYWELHDFYKFMKLEIRKGLMLLRAQLKPPMMLTCYEY